MKLKRKSRPRRLTVFLGLAALLFVVAEDKLSCPEAVNVCSLIVLVLAIAAIAVEFGYLLSWPDEDSK